MAIKGGGRRHASFPRRTRAPYRKRGLEGGKYYGGTGLLPAVRHVIRAARFFRTDRIQPDVAGYTPWDPNI